MEVFRITNARFADQLYAPGIEGRWNKKGEEVIYTSSSRSLACLENLAHKQGRGGVTTKTMVIFIPDEFNFVLNARHTDFKEVKLMATVPFHFDKRLWEDIKK